MKFAIKVRNLSGTIRSTGALEHLRNPTLINTITDKLPTQINLNWACYKLSIGVTDLAVLGDWLSQIAEAASLVVRTTSKRGNRKKEEADKKDQHKVTNNQSSKSSNYVNAHVQNTSRETEAKSSEKSRSCPACNSESCSKLARCAKFKESGRAERWTIVKENKLCTRCLGGHHFYRCTSTLECKIEGCKAKHHTLLHNSEKSSETQEAKATKSNATTSNSTNRANSSERFKANASHSNSTLSRRNRRIDIFRIVPVKIFHKDRMCQIFAYLDDGSNMTTMEASLANEMGISGTSSPLCVDWAFGQSHSSVESKIISTRISGCFDNAPQYELDNVRTVKELHLPTQSISESWLEQYNHLRRLPITTYDTVKPRMLIGLQYSRLMVSLETIEGEKDDPIACRIRLGWVVQGPSYKNGNQSNYSMNMCECQSNDKQLHQLVKEYFTMENLGVNVSEKLLESAEIMRARQIMESTTVKRNGRYETGLLWKHDRVHLPNSYSMALNDYNVYKPKWRRTRS